jgi:signal transduction histidine kinase
LGAQGKIRLLLALLCASLLFTSIVLQKTYTPAANLEDTARTLTENLRKKESAVTNFIYDERKFVALKRLGKDPAAALKYIQEFTTDKNIWFITLRSGSLSFWSGVKVIPEYPGLIKDGFSIVREPNGYYEAIRKSEGNFSAIFFIPVKLEYAFQNQFLRNTFAMDLLNDNSIDIADFTDKQVVEIRSINDTYLFSVKLKPGEVNLKYLYEELTIWTLTLISLCILVTNIGNYLCRQGYPIVSFLVMGAFVVLTRFINLYLHWPDFTPKLQLFMPKLYYGGALNPSLGDFCINILLIAWLVIFIYIQRKKILKQPTGKFAGYVFFIACILLLVAISTALQNMFYGLVIHSKISFDVSNILNLSYFSMTGVLMLCFSFLTFFLLSEVFLTIAAKFPVPNNQKLFIFIIIIVLATVFYSLHYEFTLFYILWAILVLTRAQAHGQSAGKFDAASLAIVILVCSFISSIRLNFYESVKENYNRKIFMQKLEVPDDPNADNTFKTIEQQIITDTSIVNNFKDTLRTGNFIKSRLQKLYFNGYLSRYEFNAYVYDSKEQPLTNDKGYDLNTFKDMVLYSSYNKVSTYFYRENQSFGFLKYFAILPLMQNGEKIGTIVIDLKTKPIQTAASFPGLLIDGQLNDDEALNGYSYAFYTDDRLWNQSGNYTYDLLNTNLKGQLRKYVIKTTKYNGDVWFRRFDTYNHLIFKPTARNLIVVSKEESPLFFIITSSTFFFVVFMVFSALVILVRWLWLRIKILSIKNNRISWNFKINLDLVLYRTRIQFSMIFAVVTTLLLVGTITFFSIGAEFEAQQNKTTRDKITKIVIALEEGPYTRYLSNTPEENQVEFDDFANNYSADLTLFNLKGEALLTTQPKIYDFGLQPRRMNARAYVNLAGLKKSEFANDEKIGLLNYRAAFMPVRNSASETVAYLQLPYFSNESDYKEHIGSLLNIMLNVYAIVFMAIGLFAIFIARQITSPLNFIQHSLSKTVYGKKNEPIKWGRDDEIGALVKEYNKMIAQLENSAQKLAQSERENAWREMAKQVAHEIKNPLTPLKLGLQLLDKSWKDKDPKFDQKFERFSKSFVEQIESLSSIASEFSAFAKMPETRMVRLNVFDVLNQAVTIFKEMDNIRIVFVPPDDPFIVFADRNQLLRCFNNLLKNAIEATPQNQTGIIEINYLMSAKNVLLTIRDNGEGIPDNLREKIFEPNFTTKSSGTGLGLAFVKNSIENAGGKIWFETASGLGTTFYISLPAAEQME